VLKAQNRDSRAAMATDFSSAKGVQNVRKLFWFFKQPLF